MSAACYDMALLSKTECPTILINAEIIASFLISIELGSTLSITQLLISLKSKISNIYTVFLNFIVFCILSTVWNTFSSFSTRTLKCKLLNLRK